jgi:hypothetical protein
MMESISEQIPVSLYQELSKILISIVLDAEKKNVVPSDLAKKIIYLWRQEQLATPTGIASLLEAAMKVSTERTLEVLDELGLNEITIAMKNLA